MTPRRRDLVFLWFGLSEFIYRCLTCPRERQASPPYPQHSFTIPEKTRAGKLCGLGASVSVAAESQASFLCRNKGAGHTHDHSFGTPALLRARVEDDKGSGHTSAVNPWQLGEKCSGEKECFPPKAWFGGAVLETNRCLPKHFRPLFRYKKTTSD